MGLFVSQASIHQLKPGWQIELESNVLRIQKVWGRKVTERSVISLAQPYMTPLYIFRMLREMIILPFSPKFSFGSLTSSPFSISPIFCPFLLISFLSSHLINLPASAGPPLAVFYVSHYDTYNQPDCLHYFVQHKLLHRWSRRSTDGTWTVFHRLFRTTEPDTSAMQREASLH